jgi:hypothetical protein
MLEQVTDPEYQGHPHYGHDLSFEVKQAFSTRGSDYQLEANVENDSHREVECVRFAHYPGGTTAGDLNQVYHNLIVFEPHADSTIIRQWSTRFSDCSYTALAMESGLHPGSPTAEFNIIQLTLFRQGIEELDPVRDGVSLDDAQIGILDVKVGIIEKGRLEIRDGQVIDNEPYCLDGSIGVSCTVGSQAPLSHAGGSVVYTAGSSIPVPTGRLVSQVRAYDLAGRSSATIYCRGRSVIASGAVAGRDARGLFLVRFE